VKENMSYLERQAEILSERTETPMEDILAEFGNRVKEGYSERGAVMIWKSAHKNILSSGEAGENLGRVIGKSSIREGDYGKYGFIGVLIHDDGILETKQISLSDTTVPKMGLMEFDKVYKFKAHDKDGRLTRLRAIEPVDNSSVPRVQELSAYDYGFPRIDDLKSVVGTSVLLHGWIGRIIRSRQTSEIIGFEFGDEETMIPITCWGSYAPDEIQVVLQEVDQGDEIYQYSYVNINQDGDISANINGLFKA